MLLYEDYWRQCNLIWSWIDERPVWLSAVDWDIEVLPNPDEPMQRVFRFTLLGGGQIMIREHFEPSGGKTEIPGFKTICHQTDLRVTADAGAGLRHFTGVIDDFAYEMNAHAVLFRPGTPQAVADRVAATFRLLTYSHLVGGSTVRANNGCWVIPTERRRGCSGVGRCSRPC
jgi:hypothetical protein